MVAWSRGGRAYRISRRLCQRPWHRKATALPPASFLGIGEVDVADVYRALVRRCLRGAAAELDVGAGHLNFQPASAAREPSEEPG